MMMMMSTMIDCILRTAQRQAGHHSLNATAVLLLLLLLLTMTSSLSVTI